VLPLLTHLSLCDVAYALPDLDLIHTRVLRGLKFCVRTRPAPRLHEIEKFCPHPPRTLLTRTRPADHPNPPHFFGLKPAPVR